MPVESCPICCRLYARLGQHLKVFHLVKNVQERKLLLSLESGRINIRQGRCPVPGCGKETSRMDRHFKAHVELSEAARSEYVMASKRQKGLELLSALRATNPEVPMVSTLDLESEHTLMEDDPMPLLEGDEEDEECTNAACKRLQAVNATMRAQISDLNQQVDTLSSALKSVTRRYRVLSRRSGSKGASKLRQVTKKLLSSLGPEEETEVAEETSPASPEGLPSTHEEPSDTQPPSDTLLTSSVPRAHSSTNVQTSQPPGSPPHYPDHVVVLNGLLEEYRLHQEGPDPAYKLKENVSGKIYRIKKFLGFMSEGKSNLASLCFLNETSKIHAWISYLRQSHMKETTVRHYVQNVAQFMNYITETPPTSCRLSKTVLIGLRREMRRVLKLMGRSVAMHQVEVKAKKEEQVVSKANLQKCQELSKKAIPDILDNLEKNPNYKNMWRFYGYFSAFLTSLYGHRGGVLQNMTIQEVQGARFSITDKAHVINVRSHKTNKAFGPAQIALLDSEYEWAQRFLRIKNKLPGGKDANYFFFTSKPNPCKNLNGYFQEAWKEMELPGCPTFTDIRTSIASHVRFMHGDDDRNKLSKFMCHDVRTADKYYVTNLTVKQALEHRRMFEGALEGEKRSPSETELPKKRKRPLRKAPRPCKRVSPDLTDVTSASTSPEDAEKHQQESGVSTLGSEKDDPDSSQTGSGEMEAAEVTREETKGMKKLRVVLTPLGLKARLRPRRISPLKVGKVKALTRSKNVSNKVKKCIEKRRRKI